MTAAAPASSAMRACSSRSISNDALDQSECVQEAYLLRIDNVHDNATLQHLGQTGLDGEVIAGGTVGSGHCEM